MNQFYSFVLLVLLSACSQPTGNYIIPDSSEPLGKGEVLFTKSDSCYLYAIKIIDSYMVLLDDKSDLAMQTYTLNNFTPTNMFCTREEGENRLISPQFVHSDSRNEYRSNQFSIVDNSIDLKQITLSETGMKIENKPLDRGLQNSKDYNITSKEIYAVPVSNQKNYSFYYYNIDSGYYRVNSAPIITENLPKNPAAFISNLCVNEAKQSAVSAFRFTNYVTFYDLYGNIKSNCQFGKSIFAPTHSGDKLDVKNSTKCFTSIYCTPKYVYCLYDGSTNFTASSRILIFRWNGKHVKTCQADRNLRTFAVSEDNNILYAISTNPSGGQDILKYLLE